MEFASWNCEVSLPQARLQPAGNAGYCDEKVVALSDYPHTPMARCCGATYKRMRIRKGVRCGKSGGFGLEATCLTDQSASAIGMIENSELRKPWTMPLECILSTSEV